MRRGTLRRKAEGFDSVLVDTFRQQRDGLVIAIAPSLAFAFGVASRKSDGDDVTMSQ